MLRPLPRRVSPLSRLLLNRFRTSRRRPSSHKLRQQSPARGVKDPIYSTICTTTARGVATATSISASLATVKVRAATIGTDSATWLTSGGDDSLHRKAGPQGTNARTSSRLEDGRNPHPLHHQRCRRQRNLTPPTPHPGTQPHHYNYKKAPSATAASPSPTPATGTATSASKAPGASATPACKRDQPAHTLYSPSRTSPPITITNQTRTHPPSPSRRCRT